MTITQEELKKLLNYDPETGIFKWICNKRRSNGSGCAGTLVYRNGKRYMQISIDSKKYYAHRLAWLYMYSEFPHNTIDHINGNGLDNSVSNLRDVTIVDNRRNHRKYNTNKSGLVGVCWDNTYKKWKSYINLYGVLKNIGHYDNIFDAACARKSAQHKYGFHKNHGSDRPL